VPPSTLVGRDKEVAVLAELLEDLPQRGAAIVLRGETGVGKSSLLSVAVRHAADAGRAVLWVTGVESEAQVPFSGLHRLLRPILPEVDALPRRQREALLSAFGMAEPAAEPYLVSYAALELVAERAAEVPVVLVVDDVQWLDPPSASALAFLARRIEYEPVAALFALRDGFDSPLADGSIPELVVPVLDDQQSVEMLDRHSAHLPATARHQILELAAGNPLALEELSKAWSPTDSSLLAPGALTARLERAFARRVEALPDDVRLATLVAAANDTDELAEVVRATEVLTGPTRGEALLTVAEGAGVLVIEDPKVHFGHPLIRSACYQGALPSQRRAAHAALADVLTTSAERRTWHRAASTIGPADDIADKLEEAAVSATRRGSALVGVAALTRAADLSGSEPERGRRLTTAAELAFEAAMHAQGADLLDRAAASDLADEDRLRVSWLKEWFGDPSWSGAEKVRSLCHLAARMAEQGQVDRALKMVLNVALRCWWSNPDDDTTQTLLETAEVLGAHLDDPTLVTILGYGAPVERGRVVAERIASFSPDALEQPADALNLGTAATGVGAFPLAAPFLDDAIGRFRTRGEMVLLLQGLVARALTDYHLGRWMAARADGDEIRQLTVDTAQPLWGMAAAGPEALVAAAQGDEDGVDLLCRQAEAFFLPLGATTFLAPVEMARGLSALSQGRHEEALHHLRRVFDPDSPVYHRYARHWVAVDYVEAALVLGHRDEAVLTVEAMESLWDTTGSPLLGVCLRVTRPLVTEGGRAEQLYHQGLTGDLPHWPFLHARHLLAYGIWLRRHRRARDSRPYLRSSRDIFDALGAIPWYQRATRELRASGETSRERQVGAGHQLSPQESQIAQLAATGLTNREIGQHLYLSHRTVGSHLYRIFPKLGITSRGQLGSALLSDSTGDGTG
jgi:DNA-binding CsgD family transcriptional regulator